MGIYEELQARGLIAQVTNEPEIREMVNNGKATFYIGFDPTADSLHVGHFMALCLMKRLQMAGNRPVALVWRRHRLYRRPLRPVGHALDDDAGDHPAQLRLLQKADGTLHSTSGEGKAIMVNNADWLLKLNYIELLREVGACFSVNNMLRAECYKQRMEKGLQLPRVQLHDHAVLRLLLPVPALRLQHAVRRRRPVVEHARRHGAHPPQARQGRARDDHHAAHRTREGKKMGKTAKGAVWLDPNKTTPFEFYQYWRNVGDADVLKCIRMLTFLPLEQIDEMDKWEGSQLNQRQGDPCL